MMEAKIEWQSAEGDLRIIKLTSRSPLIGTSYVLEELVSEMDQVGDRTKRWREPECSPATIDKLCRALLAAKR